MQYIFCLWLLWCYLYFPMMIITNVIHNQRPLVILHMRTLTVTEKPKKLKFRSLVQWLFLFHSFFLRACNKYAQRYSTYVFIRVSCAFFYISFLYFIIYRLECECVSLWLITYTNVTHKRAPRNSRNFVHESGSHA